MGCSWLDPMLIESRTAPRQLHATNPSSYGRYTDMDTW